MKSILISASLLLFTATSFAQSDDCSDSVAALRALYEARQILLRPYGSTYDVDQRIDHYLDELREPLPSGGYRWVRFVRPSSDAPTVKKEHTVGAEYNGSDFDTFEGGADHPFAVKVVVPRKRSLTKANNEAYVGTVEIHYWVDGREKTMTKEINQWMAPDTSKTIDLGVIADRAEASAETSTRNASKRESLVELHFKQAVAQDDPENPNYEAIQSLKRVASSTDPATIDYEIARFEKMLFPSLVSMPYTTLITRVREAQKLIESSKTEDQEKGKKMLQETMRGIPR